MYNIHSDAPSASYPHGGAAMPREARARLSVITAPLTPGRAGENPPRGPSRSHAEQRLALSGNASLM